MIGLVWPRGFKHRLPLVLELHFPLGYRWSVFSQIFEGPGELGSDSACRTACCAYQPLTQLETGQRCNGFRVHLNALVVDDLNVETENNKSLHSLQVYHRVPFMAFWF